MEFYDDNGNVWTWAEICKGIDDWIKDGSFQKDMDEDDLKKYFDKDGTPRYSRIYKDYLDISVNGAYTRVVKTAPVF